MFHTLMLETVPYHAINESTSKLQSCIKAIFSVEYVNVSIVQEVWLPAQQFQGSITELLKLWCSQLCSEEVWFFLVNCRKALNFQKIHNYCKPVTMPSLSLQNMDMAVRALQ